MPRVRDKRSARGKYTAPIEQSEMTCESNMPCGQKKRRVRPVLKENEFDDTFEPSEECTSGSLVLIVTAIVTLGVLAGFLTPGLLISKPTIPAEMESRIQRPKRASPPPEEMAEYHISDKSDDEYMSAHTATTAEMSLINKHTPPPPSPPQRSPGLTAAQCSTFLRDPTHIFRRMWASDAWSRMSNGESRGSEPCWLVEREVRGGHKSQSADDYFKQTFNGAHCDSNWFEGNPGELGKKEARASFSRSEAPALLGFDESIDNFCAQELGGWDSAAKDMAHAQRCVKASHNILSLYGERLPYNVCRNLEWQVCAARGLLPGQGGRSIRFAKAPASLQPDGRSGKPLGQCCGWVPPDMVPQGGVYGYTTDDIFYLETCIFAQICINRDQLFELKVGDSFICELADDKFAQLQELLLSPWEPAEGDVQCTEGKTCIEMESGQPPTCSMCWRVNNGNGDCSALPGCNKELCGFCSNGG